MAKLGLKCNLETMDERLEPMLAYLPKLC